jgi:hypothetical protein
VGINLSGANLLLVYADDVNLLSDNKDTIKKNKETFTDASEEFGLQVNVEKPMYMLLCCHQNARQNHDMKIAKRCFENVTQLRYLGMAVTNQNLIQEDY